MARYAREYPRRRGAYGRERRRGAAVERRGGPAGIGRGAEGYARDFGYGAAYRSPAPIGYGGEYRRAVPPAYRARYGPPGYAAEYGPPGYAAEYGPPGYAAAYGRPRYGVEYGPPGRRRRLPGKAARGYPVRGIHTYDLDYGDMAGPTTEYSGRAGYAEDREWEETPRGPYTPRLADIGRAARMRRRLYERGGPTYSGPGRRGRGWR
ncbi:MAG TPA: hypothetical protein VF212_06970 [Longimicrobiales bacterium]